MISTSMAYLTIARYAEHGSPGTGFAFPVSRDYFFAGGFDFSPMPGIAVSLWLHAEKEHRLPLTEAVLRAYRATCAPEMFGPPSSQLLQWLWVLMTVPENDDLDLSHVRHTQAREEWAHTLGGKIITVEDVVQRIESGKCFIPGDAWKSPGASELMVIPPANARYAPSVIPAGRIGNPYVRIIRDIPEASQAYLGMLADRPNISRVKQREIERAAKGFDSLQRMMEMPKQAPVVEVPPAVTEPVSPTLQTDLVSVDNADTIQLAIALGDDTAAKIIKIANRDDLNANEKMRLIATLDNRYYGYKSPRLGGLLKIRAATVRQLDWWTIDRKKWLDDHKSFEDNIDDDDN